MKGTTGDCERERFGMRWLTTYAALFIKRNEREPPVSM